MTTIIMNDNLYLYLNNLYFCSVSQIEAEEEGGNTAKQTEDEGEEEGDLSTWVRHCLAVPTKPVQCFSENIHVIVQLPSQDL